jgi:hypothetical protein
VISGVSVVRRGPRLFFTPGNIIGDIRELPSVTVNYDGTFHEPNAELSGTRQRVRLDELLCTP